MYYYKFKLNELDKNQLKGLNLGCNLLNARLKNRGFSYIDTYNTRIYYYEDDEHVYMFYIEFPNERSNELKIKTVKKMSIDTLKEIADLLRDFAHFSTIIYKSIK